MITLNGFRQVRIKLSTALAGGDSGTLLRTLRNLVSLWPSDVFGSVTASGTITANIGTTNGLALDASVAALHTRVADANNGSVATLAAGATFTGTATDVTMYESVQVGVISDVASAVNGLQLQFSADNVNWDFVASTSYPGGSVGITVPSGAREKWFRVVYTNGSTNQSSFRLTTKLTPGVAEVTKRFLSQPPTDSQLALLVNAVLTGKVTASGSKYTNVVTDVYGSLQTVIAGQAADAFGRLRIANPVSLF